METYSTSSSSLGGPSQFYPQTNNYENHQRVSSFEKLNTKALAPFEKSKNPSLSKIASLSNPLMVQPSIVKFETIDIGIRYVQNISVRNLTKGAQRIRFIAPKSPYFSLNYIPSGAIAPGLDVIAEVECQLPESSEQYIFTDNVTVVMGQHTIDIPIVANKPAPDVVYNPFVDMGLLLEKQPSSTTVTFENRGQVPAVIQFKTTRESKFQLDPLKSSIEPKSTLTLNIRCDTRELGSYRELIPLTVTGLAEEMTLDISAQVLNQKLNLMSGDKKGVLDHLDFGTLYYGQSKEIRAVLVNTGPILANYTIGFQDDAESDGQLSSTTGGGGVEMKSVSITPLDGMIHPFSEVPVVIKYQPQLMAPKKGFIKQHLLENAEVNHTSYRVNIDVLDLADQSSHLIIHGGAVLPTYKLSSSILRFGSVPLNDHRDILLSLQSASPIPMKFQFSKGAQYKFSPPNGILQPGQTLSILATIFPVQLGEIKKVCMLSIEDGIREAEIRIIGDCVPSNLKKRVLGGTNLLPEDFQHVPKFVDPVEVTKQRFSQTADGAGTGAEKGSKFQRIQPWNSQEFLSTTSWDEVYESTATAGPGGAPGGGGAPVSGNNDPVTYSLQELQRRSNHKETYTQFLRQSHAKRIASKHHKIKLKAKMLRRNDPEDPLGVDMGMEKGLGDGPVLKIPVANEPLWLANSGEKGDKKKFQIDENRLITKKGKDAPTTQAEQRDCALELSPEQLRHVTPSHKIINFGKVCVNSVNYKNFAITNELQQAVLIKLNSLESEVRGSKPLAQLAQPNGGVIGFDIQFVCHDVGKYKKTFGWSVNDRHSFKVTVLAEVIPIEITLDKHSLTMEFSNESLEKSQMDKLVMTNPGNAIAEFVWGNRGAFRCVPEQGSLHPGQSMVVTVIWTPDPNHSNTEEISLLVTGGTEQVVSMTGVLSEGKITFEEKKLAIGVIAVGSEKKYSVTLKNTGHSPTVFFVSEIPTGYAMEIKPDRGFLYPEEVIDLDVLIRPKNRINYDNKAISMNVRGGKTISLKLSGEAVIPKVTLEQSSFHFGHVVTGSRQLLPFTLTNVGTIDVVLLLDFQLYPDFQPCLTSSEDSTMMDLSTAGSSNGIWEDSNGNILEHFRDNNNSSSSSSSHKWKMVIRVNTSLSGYLIFAPSVAKAHNFKLPLAIQGIPQEGSLPPCQVTADGLLSRLNVSSYVVDFQDRVVARDPSSRMSYFKEIVFKNIDISAGLSYEIKEPHPPPPSTSPITKGNKKPHPTIASQPSTQIDDQPVFFVSPMRGDLSPNESSTIRVTFLPKLNGDFHKVLHIFISGQPDPTRPYFTLLIRGSGVYPRLTFSKHRLYLPPVPLNITSRVSCVIYNQGYDTIELRYRVSPTIPVPLTILFPEGNELGLTKEKCTIVICARCEISESWIGKIEFYDTDGEKFFLDVSGCSDSSLFTVDPFVRCYGDRYGFLALDDQPVRYCLKKDIAILKSQEVKMKSANRKKMLETQQSTNALAAAGASAPGGAGGGGGEKNRKTVMKKSEGIDPSESLLSGASSNAPPGAPPPAPTVASSKTVPLDDLSEGIDITRNDAMSSCDDDVLLLVKWLNQCICKKPFDVNNLLECILKTHGDLVVDCIEQLCGKKIAQSLHAATAGPSNRGGGGLTDLGSTEIKNDAHSNGNSDVINSMSNRLANLNKLLVKYSNLLAFLTRSGGLVMHLPPSSLLGRDDYLLANEIDFKQAEGIRLTQAMLKEKRTVWHEEWEMICFRSWSQILFQSYKIFVLGRITYKDYTNTPGVVIQPAVPSHSQDKSSSTKAGPATGGAGAGGGAKGGAGGGSNDSNKKKKKIDNSLKCPPELQASNILSQSEAVVLAWIAYHQLRASRLPDSPSHTTPMNANSRMPSMNRRIIDPTAEFQDFFILCQVIHSHLPDLTQHNGPLTGYTFTEPFTPESQKENYERLVETLTSLRLNFQIQISDFVQHSNSGRAMMILLVHFFLNLPNFIPKTVIEFKGSLSTPILKTIELRNPSKKMVCYDVTLSAAANGDGCSTNDYSIEHQSIVLEPDSVSGYTVICTPHFSKPSKGKLTFWGVREHGVGGSNLVFELISKVTDRPPLQTIKKSCALFDHETVDVEVTNPFAKECNFTIQLVQTHLPMTLQQYFGQQQMTAGHSARMNPPNPKGLSGGGGGAASNKRNSVSGTNQAMAALLNEVNGSHQPNTQRGGGGGGGNEGGGDDDDMVLIQKLFTDPLWINETSLLLSGNETKKIHLHMLPFILGEYTCQIIFVEPSIGEFCYNLQLNVTPPKPMEELSFDHMQTLPSDMGGGGTGGRGGGRGGDAIQKVIRVSSSNTLFEKAVMAVTDARLPLNRRVKARSILQNLLHSSISNEDTGASQFGIEMDNNYFQPQKEFGLVCSSAGAAAAAGGGGGGAGAGGRNPVNSAGGPKKYLKVLKNSIEPYVPSDLSVNSLHFSFYPERAGIYKSLVLMYSLSNQYDIRCLLVTAKITPSNTSLSLIFKGPARQKIFQEIPLVNESEIDWNLQAMLNGRGFSGPKTLTVPSKGQAVYTVSFTGPHIGEFDGTLHLKNLSSSSSSSSPDSYDFKLKGIAEEPLAEMDLHYNLRARHSETFTLRLPFTGLNANEPQVLAVETDIQYLSGDSEIVVVHTGGAGGSNDVPSSSSRVNEYSFSLNCPVGGHMNGSLTFKDKNNPNQMVWYTLDIDITSPAAESTIEVEAEVRKAVAVEITLENPTQESLVFEVAIEGEGLLGDSTFTLPPPTSPSRGSTGIYELIYSPLKAGNFLGSITFMNDVIGEFWYQVILTATAASPIVVKIIECMVGTTGTSAVAIENPLAFPITCSASIEDPHHFAIQPEVISLGPYAQSSFTLFFTPSSLNEVINSTIILTNKSLGDVVYHVSGKGSLPGVMPAITISAPMNEIGSHTIPFRNPFPFPLPLDIILTENSNRRGGRGDPSSSNAFSLLIKKSTGIVLASETSIQTAISFQPTHLGDYNAAVEYRATISGRNLLWCYPLQGIAEAGISFKLPKLAIECKSSLLREVQVPLIGLFKSTGGGVGGDGELTLSDFNLEVKPRDKSQSSLIARTFRVQFVDIIDTSTQQQQHTDTAGATQQQQQVATSQYSIVLRLLFEPLKSYRSEVDILMKCQTKGQWRADIQLEALDPPPDDTITLTAAVGESDKVAFRLTNRFLGYSPFEAYFTARSSPHFVVSPSSGVLAPFGSSEGTQFVITFTPKEYGTRELATLVVSTAEAQWNYQITGTYPDVRIVRSMVKSKVDTGRG